MKKIECDTMKVLIKAVMPHRQKVLTQDGQEMRLQQWANKQAASALRDAGGDAQGEQFSQSRDMLMRDAVENPDKHGLKFMGERLPFEGQNLQESLSEPTFDNEADKEIADFHHEEELRTYGKDESEIERDARYPGGVKLPGEELPNLFDSEGKLRDGMPPEEEGFLQANNKVTWKDMPSEERTKELLQQEEEFNPDKEAEHMRRIMTSRQVPMRDTWSILKNLQFPADAGNRREFQRMPGEEHGPNDKFFRYGEDPYVPKGHGENPMRAERPHPYSQLGANVMEDYQLMQEEPEDNQLLTPDELAFAQFIAENDMQMPPAARIPAPTLRQGMNQYNPPIKTSRQVPMRDAWSVLKNDFFNPPEVPCAKCGKPTEPMMYYGSNQMGPQHNTLCEECEDNTMMEDQ